MRQSATQRGLDLPPVNTLYPTTITANRHTVLILRDPTWYTSLREMDSNVPFKNGFLPDLAFWQREGVEVVAVESPRLCDDGQLWYRIWIAHSCDQGVSPDHAVPEAVVPSSIRPGLPSRVYKPDPEGWNWKYGCHLFNDNNPEAEGWAAGLGLGPAARG